MRRNTLALLLAGLMVFGLIGTPPVAADQAGFRSPGGVWGAFGANGKDVNRIDWIQGGSYCASNKVGVWVWVAGETVEEIEGLAESVSFTIDDVPLETQQTPAKASVDAGPDRVEGSLFSLTVGVPVLDPPPTTDWHELTTMLDGSPWIQVDFYWNNDC